MRLRKFSLLVALLIFVDYHDLASQDYVPLADWSKENAEIIRILRRQSGEAVKTFDRSYRAEAYPIFKRTLTTLTMMVQRGGVIRNDDLQYWINSTFDKL